MVNVSVVPCGLDTFLGGEIHQRSTLDWWATQAHCRDTGPALYIRRPLVGHQAVRSSFEVYNSIASIDRLQTSKYIALLTSMFTASFSAFKSSCNLFLCCYTATGASCYHPQLTALRLGSPRESLKIASNCRYSFQRFVLPK
jgi:hypothetical protein